MRGKDAEHEAGKALRHARPESRFQDSSDTASIRSSRACAESVDPHPRFSNHEGK
jgi:hypothetical protein